MKPTPRTPLPAATKTAASAKLVKLAKAPHFVRIIGGEWKRTRLAVADKPGLRPTPDRVRETLFNWLASLAGAARGEPDRKRKVVVLEYRAGSSALTGIANRLTTAIRSEDTV